MKRKSILFLVASLIISIATAQENKYDFKGTLRASCDIPNPTSNAAFRKSFVGVYEINASFNYTIYKGLYLGTTFKNGLFKMPSSKILEINTKAETYNYGGKIGYEHFLSETILFSFSMNGGRNFTKYTSVICTNLAENKPHQYNSTYFEPELNIYFFIEDNIAIGINISEMFLQKPFDPYAICLDEHSFTYTPQEITGVTSYLSFGFGVYVGLWKKKST